MDVFGLKDFATRKVFLNRLGSAALRQTVDEQLTMLQSETPGSITLSFVSAEEAHQVRTAAVEHVRDRIRDAFVAADKNAHEVVRAVGAKLTARLQREIGSIAGKVPTLPEWSFDKSVTVKVSERQPAQVRETTEGGIRYVERTERSWKTLWLWEKTVRVWVPEPMQVRERYLIKVDEVVADLNAGIQTAVTQIRKELTSYLSESLAEAIRQSFEVIEDHLERQRRSLESALRHKELSLDRRSVLEKDLKSLRADSGERLRSANSLLRKVKGISVTS